MELIIIVVIGILVLFFLFKLVKAFLKWSIILLIACLVVAYFTNPQEAKHMESLSETVKDLPVKKVRKKFVHVTDYKIFSLTKVTVDGKEKIVGIGAFGKIWYFGKIEDKLKKKQ